MTYNLSQAIQNPQKQCDLFALSIDYGDEPAWETVLDLFSLAMRLWTICITFLSLMDIISQSHQFVVNRIEVVQVLGVISFQYTVRGDSYHY